MLYKSLIQAITISTSFLCLSMNAASSSPMKILRDFDKPSGEPAWFAQNDGVMGGVSSGWGEIKEGHLQFSGELSLENNGGFAQIYSRIEQSDLTKYTGVRLRVKGDGRDFQFRIATDARFRGSRIAYRATFPTEADEWTEISIPFSSFVPSFRGNFLNGPPLDLSSIRQIAFLLADGNPGPFSLVVDWIGLEGDENSLPLDAHPEE
ncbi:CIA30 family protein [Puniceicoccales bacterium CK1056]|uniref:CIA30 family protein n=1 Tax=Oceanipulchritudo coccoides TaxID=2706888 RepID=A0A6B2LZU3_9BACT|nr:CIA30 family protein [Oceanipulchritudo coccoides]NDV61672.1 CIA30 family protein [Oceanipulchritudo coccoides]